MFVHFSTCVQNPIMDICKNGTHLLPRDNLSHCVQRRCSTWKKEGICCLRNKLKMQVYFASSWVYWTNPIDITDHLCCFQKHLHRMNIVWGNVIQESQCFGNKKRCWKHSTGYVASMERETVNVSSDRVVLQISGICRI